MLENEPYNIFLEEVIIIELLVVKIWKNILNKLMIKELKNWIELLREKRKTAVKWGEICMKIRKGACLNVV